MGRRTNYGFNKRQKEQKKREKAEKKRERKLLRKESGDRGDDIEGERGDGPQPTTEVPNP